MLKRVLSYSVVVLLLLVLVGGSVYILARPQAAEGAEREAASQAEPQYGGRNSAGGGRSQSESRSDGRNAAVNGGSQTGEPGQQSERRGRAQAATPGSGDGNQEAYVSAESHTWQTIQGTVIESGNELLVATAEGDVLVGLGQAFYRDEVGFTVAVGDEVLVDGYEEDGEFKAALVENLSEGTSVTLRDANGRPMWAGRGNLQNRP